MINDEANRALKELDDVLDDLDELLKRNDVGAVLAERGINISLALTAANGLRAYIKGDKATAIDDLGTVAEEIAARAGSKA
ncbi:MAG: hypothetical protein U0269_10940 [Polyangiales bacterium]